MPFYQVRERTAHMPFIAVALIYNVVTISVMLLMTTLANKGLGYLNFSWVRHE